VNDLSPICEPNYSPANESELVRQLGLNKKQRAMLAHEVRRLTASGGAARKLKGERCNCATAAAKPSRSCSKVAADLRPIFVSPAQRPVAPESPARSAWNADELVGRIQFRAGGSAFVVLEGADGGPGDPREPGRAGLPRGNRHRAARRPRRRAHLSRPARPQARREDRPGHPRAGTRPRHHRRQPPAQRPQLAGQRRRPPFPGR
jgi:ribonuclease R